MTPDRLDDWHRLFGLTLTDVFSDTPWRVELEKDLAMQRQPLIVLNTIAPHPRNAAWELFSTQHDRIRQGAASYRPRRPGTWDLLYRLIP